MRLIAAALLWMCLPVAGAQAAELIVSAAASLGNALREASKAHQLAHPGREVVLNFAASDVLLAQIAKGAPVDVFVAADTDAMDRAQKQDLLAPGTRRVLLRNTLVLIVPATAAVGLARLEHLKDAGVRRIAIGNPASVPAGRYARGALQRTGLWAALEPKLIPTQNVRQALDYVARGEVDAGLVYATDAAILPGKVRVVAQIATPVPIVYPAAVVAGTRHRAAAEAYLQHLASPAAQAIFARQGFGAP